MEDRQHHQVVEDLRTLRCSLCSTPRYTAHLLQRGRLLPGGPDEDPILFILDACLEEQVTVSQLLLCDDCAESVYVFLVEITSEAEAVPCEEECPATCEFCASPIPFGEAMYRMAEVRPVHSRGEVLLADSPGEGLLGVVCLTCMEALADEATHVLCGEDSTPFPDLTLSENGECYSCRQSRCWRKYNFPCRCRCHG